MPWHRQPLRLTARSDGLGAVVSQFQGRPIRLCNLDIHRWSSGLVKTGTCHIWMGAVGSDGYGRIAITNKFDGPRMYTPHQIAAALRFGPIPAGATVLHDCEVRLCCRTDRGHVRIGTQGENIRDAVRRGRIVGPRPGRVDVRGKVGASRAIQAALRDALDRSPGASPEALAAVLAAVIAEGDPLRDLVPLFPEPPADPLVGDAGVVSVGARPAPVPAVRRSRRAVESLPLW